jgi:pimeloyl-ACP methyl ester carboxylesterase
MTAPSRIEEWQSNNLFEDCPWRFFSVSGMSFASRIADLLVLKPSRNWIDPEQRRRHVFESPAGPVEAWIYEHRVEQESERVVAIKFPGAGGRAERGGPHPFEAWPDVSADIWVVNMPGYGGSHGRASLAHIPPIAQRVYEEIRQVHRETLPIVIGNSMGCSAALCLAARAEISALLLRNPVPLKELMIQRHSWWNGGLLTRWLVRGLPVEIDPIENARRCTAPALFFQSAGDTLVPPSLQNLVIEAYAGPKQSFIASGIDHHEPLPEAAAIPYKKSLQWLREVRQRSQK